jgi:predicted TPR repeat methyltransferase
MINPPKDNPIPSASNPPCGGSSGRSEGIAAVLRALAIERRPARLLDIGCGTGHWLNILQPLVPFACGIDLSLNMLQCVDRRSDQPVLVCGNAGRRLPFQEAAFDLVMCVNALPNFGPLDSFLLETRRLLRHGGTLAIIGSAPQHGQDGSSLYYTFGGVYHADAHRFPSWGTITDSLVEAGFDRIEWRVVERVATARVGREVFGDALAPQTHSIIAMLTGRVSR